MDEPIEGWKKTKKSNSSSLSGIHLGDGMAATQDRDAVAIACEMAKMPYEV